MYRKNLLYSVANEPLCNNKGEGYYFHTPMWYNLLSNNNTKSPYTLRVYSKHYTVTINKKLIYSLVK